jgi:hypothetical protein
MTDLKDSLKDGGKKSPPKNESCFTVLRAEETMFSVAEEKEEYKKIAKEEGLCLRCLINSEGTVKIKMEGNFCSTCGGPKLKEEVRNGH